VERVKCCAVLLARLQFDKIFEPYTEYCLKQATCHEYIKSKTAENEQFRTFISVSGLHTVAAAVCGLSPPPKRPTGWPKKLHSVTCVVIN